MPKAKTWEEYKVECEAVANVKGYKIIGHLSWCGNKTLLRIRCPRHGIWETRSILNFKSGQRGCPRCGKVSDKSRSITYEEHVKDFMSTGKFKEGTKFSHNTIKRNSAGAFCYWDYTCPRCSNDEYVEAGLCDGIFSSSINHLKEGKLSCRCASNYYYTKEQWEWRLTHTCKERGYLFKGWVDRRWGIQAKFIYKCPHHGRQTMTPSNFIFHCKGCPSCSGKNQKECYVNIVYDNSLPVALKLGISKSSDQRLKEQNRNNLFQMKKVHIYEFPSVQQCKDAEKACKDELPCGILSSRELKDGWTETTSILNLDKIIEIYERFGGKRVK